MAVLAAFDKAIIFLGKEQILLTADALLCWLLADGQKVGLKINYFEPQS